MYGAGRDHRFPLYSLWILIQPNEILPDWIKLAGTRSYRLKEQHGLFIFLNLNLEHMRCLSFDNCNPFLLIFFIRYGFQFVGWQGSCYGIQTENFDMKHLVTATLLFNILKSPQCQCQCQWSWTWAIMTVWLVVLMLNKSLCHYDLGLRKKPIWAHPLVKYELLSIIESLTQNNIYWNIEEGRGVFLSPEWVCYLF